METCLEVFLSIPCIACVIAKVHDFWLHSHLWSAFRCLIFFCSVGQIFSSLCFAAKYRLIHNVCNHLRMVILISILFYPFITEPTCGELHMADSGVISSPGYPESYPSNLNCQWNITVSPGHMINMEFNDFHIEHSPFCLNDRLMVCTIL